MTVSYDLRYDFGAVMTAGLLAQLGDPLLTDVGRRKALAADFAAIIGRAPDVAFSWYLARNDGRRG